ncbi:MAG: hypothetical protein JST85_30845 [Acidobacteria bacterium]|nr:hypothetical protein [Acidobacteriota bacterium]
MKRGEMLTGRSVSDRWQVLGYRLQVVAGLLFGLFGLIAMLHFGFGVRAAVGISGQEKSVDGIWQRTRTVAGEWAGRSGVPESARVFRLDEAALRSVLASAPLEERRGDNGTNGNNGTDGKEAGKAGERSATVLWLPMPGGGFERFRVVEAPVMKAELAAQLPDIKSYRGWGVDNPLLTMRCDLSPLGFHAMVTDGVELIAIHSIEQQDREHYVSYSSRSYTAAAEAAMCLVNESKVVHKITPMHSRNSSVGAEFREYEIAIATTQEFTTQYGGGTLPGARAALNSLLTGLQMIYDRELSISLTLVSTPQNPFLNDQVIAWSGNPISFTNGNADVMVNEVRSVLRDRIGAAEYDLGLVLGTGSITSGSACVGVVCETASDSYGPYKGGGAVLINGGAVNTPSNIAMAAHEIGHQFGATHTYNAACGGGRTGDSAWESGGGLTLMSNAGNCLGNEIVSTGRADFFHSGSFEQIIGYLNVLGGSCATLQSSLGNHPPTVEAGADYVIPKKTPFALTAIGNDPDGDLLTYTWEQVDVGGSNFANPPYTDAGDATLTTRPIFRPFTPTLVQNGQSYTRVFPSLTYILNNQNSPPAMNSSLQTAESLPQVARAMNFRATVRDTRGGVANGSMRIEVDGTAGPFGVTSPNSGVTWAGGSLQTVTWNISGTGAGSLVNCANVNILVSTDGGQTFSTLLGNTPNDGTQQVTVPNIATSTARIKVAAADNIFFDISDTNFTITSCPAITVNPSALANGFVGSSYSQTLTATGGSAPYNYFVSAGTLPNGLMLSTGGVLSGTPTTIGVFNFTVMATASNGCQGSRAYTVFVSGNGLMYFPLNPPVKLLDSRSGQSPCTVLVGPVLGGTTLTQIVTGSCSEIPATARAVTGTVTAYNPSANGFITLYPSNASQPLASNNNLQAGVTLGNAFTVGLDPVGQDKAFKIYLVPTADLEVDITGYFAPPATGGLYFHPLPHPARLLDTRAGQTACFTPNAQLTAGSTTTQLGTTNCDGVQIPASTQVLVGNATVVNQNVAGNLTLYRSDLAALPPITTGNYQTGPPLNSPFFVALSPTGQFKIYTTALTDLVIDIMGYYSPDANDVNGTGLLYTSLTPNRLLDTRQGQSACTMPEAPMTGGVEFLQSLAGSCAIPGAKALVGNATTVLSPNQGFLTLWPSDAASRPLIATSNYAQGITFNRYFNVGLGTVDGAFKRYVLSTTDLVIDISGYFAP